MISTNLQTFYLQRTFPERKNDPCFWGLYSILQDGDLINTYGHFRMGSSHCQRITSKVTWILHVKITYPTPSQKRSEGVFWSGESIFMLSNDNKKAILFYIHVAIPNDPQLERPGYLALFFLHRYAVTFSRFVAPCLLDLGQFGILVKIN